MKTCSVCKEAKPLDHYHTWKASSSGRRSECKPCFNAITRNAKYRARYGITADEADEMKKNGCKICGDTKKMVIDHNHDTGEVRGALCSACNTGLGYFKDNPDRLVAAAAYLKETGHYGA